jgi:hypothetical protein
VSVAGPEATPDERELASLYGRYKSLAVATAAAAILDAPLGGLAAETELLVADTRAAGRQGRRHAGQFDACAKAAVALRALVDRAQTGDLSPDDLEDARASHRVLRREVWSVLPCEYVPCCADDHHLSRS